MILLQTNFKCASFILKTFFELRNIDWKVKNYRPMCYVVVRNLQFHEFPTKKTYFWFRVITISAKQHALYVENDFAYFGHLKKIDDLHFFSYRSWKMVSSQDWDISLIYVSASRQNFGVLVIPNRDLFWYLFQLLNYTKTKSQLIKV